MFKIKLQLSHDALVLMLKLRAKQSISWLLAKRNWNNITNTLLQDNFIKPYGPPHKAIIYPTKKGLNIINKLVPKKLALEYEHLKKKHLRITVIAFIWLLIGFILMGYNRWLLLRIAPVSLVGVLGIECICVYQYVPVDSKIYAIEQSIQNSWSVKSLKSLFKQNHLKWNHNVDTYFLDVAS